MTRSVVIKAAHDPEAGVWYVEESDLFGLNAENRDAGRLGG